jgi:hypothetical protein
MHAARSENICRQPAEDSPSWKKELESIMHACAMLCDSSECECSGAVWRAEARPRVPRFSCVRRQWVTSPPPPPGIALTAWHGVCSVLCVCVCGCTVPVAGVTECLCLRVQESFARIGLRGAVEDIGGEERALWHMIIYHILGIIVFAPLDRTLVARQPCTQSRTVSTVASPCTKR